MSEIPTMRFSAADETVRVSLTGLSTRQRIIANNVANADTPNFKASEVPFEDVLRQELQRGRPRPSRAALQALVSEARTTQGTTARADGNNVDIDREMVQLAETTLRFNTLTQAMAARLSLLRSVVSDGRR